MTPQQYQSALTTLSLTPDQAAIWLGIGRSTAYRYLKTGCEGAVERCLEMAVGVIGVARIDWTGRLKSDGQLCFHEDLTAAVGLPK